MEITANITRMDVFKANLYLFPRSKGTWKFFGVLVFGYLIYFSISNEHETLIQWAVLAMGAVVGGVFVLLICFISSIICLFFASKQKNSFIGKFVYLISEQGLNAKSQYNEVFTKWSGIESVTKSRSYIYLRLNSFLYHLIPRQAFRDEAEFEEFGIKANGYWKEANSKK